MAFLIGDGGAGNAAQASDNNDLLDRLVLFLTGVSLPLAERWTILKDTSNLPASREVYLRGPGLSGTDSIYVNLRTNRNDANLIYNLEIRGAVGFDTNETFEEQPQSSPSQFVLLDNLAFNYWFVGSGRRFIVVAQIQTTWQHGYAGLYLPFATPAEFPYPMFIGGSTSRSDIEYRNDTFAISAYWDAANSAYVLHRDNTWLLVQNISTAASSRTPLTGRTTVMYPYSTYMNNLAANIDGSYTLIPIVIETTNFGGNSYGELEGIFAVSGNLQLPGSIIDIGGVDYLVAGNSNRIGIASFAALRLQ